MDISTLGATLIDRTITNNDIITVNDWLDGADHPTFIRQQDSFKTIELTFIISAGSEEKNLLACSKIINNFKAENELTFEDMPTYTFDVVLSTNQVSRLRPAVWQLVLTFKAGYARTAEVTTDWDMTTNLTIKNPGTAVSAFRLSLVINDAADIVSETIYVNGEELPFRNLVKGHTYIFDSGKGTFWDDTLHTSVIDKYVGYVLPKMQPGNNVFGASWNVGLNASISYYPQYI